MGIEFVSYDGAYPNLCSGTLVLKIDGKEVTFPNYCMSSGGSVWFDEDWGEHIEDGPWTLSDIPAEYAHLKAEIEDVINDNVSEGCCGGCI